MSLYRPAGSKIFWMDFRFHGQRIRQSTAMPSITRARQVEEKRKQELRDGTAGIKKRETPKLFSSAAKEWTEAKQPKWSAAMGRMAETALKHLLPAFGKKLVVDIEARDVQLYQKAREDEGASGRTSNIEIGVLRGVLKRAGFWARIQPFITMQEERDDVGRALTAAEEKALLEESARSNSRVLLPFITVLLETGSRYGTVRRLQWKNIDFENRCLTFGKDKTRAGSGRTVPLTPRAQQTLQFWAEQFPDRKPEHYVFPHERYGAAGRDDVFGFTEAHAYDTDISRPTGAIKVAWEQARKRTRRHCPQCGAGRLAEAPEGYACGACGWQTAELPAGLTGVRIHDLRHTAVSRMIAAKIPMPIIARIVGWSAGTMAKMAARYGHFSLDEMREAMSAIAPPAEEISVGYPKKSPKSDASESGRIQ